LYPDGTIKKEPSCCTDKPQKRRRQDPSMPVVCKNQDLPDKVIIQGAEEAPGSIK